MQPEPIRLLSFPVGRQGGLDSYLRHLVRPEERTSLESISQAVRTTGK